MSSDLTVADLAPALESMLEEVNLNQSEVYDLAKSDLDFFGSIAMPEAVKFPYPPVFKAIWALLLSLIYKKRDFTRLAIGLPRGFGKTTLMKLFCAFCILYTSRKFILVTAATATLAENIISDVFDMLDEDNIRQVYGDWRLGVEKDTQAVKKFGFRGRNIIVAGLGQGGSVRGLNIKNARPDVEIFEDIQSREDADSELVSGNIDRWMVGTAMKAKAYDGCLFIFVGNMYPTKHSLLRKLKHDPNWVKFISGGILADGTSLWEDLQPLKQLLEEWKADKSAGHESIFLAEVLNDENASVNSKVDTSAIPDYPYDIDGEVSSGGFIIIDPSNDKANSDNVCISGVEIYNGTPVVCQIINEKLSPSKIVEEAIKLALDQGYSLIAVEAVAFQYSLCHWFEVYFEKLRISSIQVVPVYPGTKSKNSRILEMFKAMVQAEFHIHPKVKSVVLDQITSFNPLKSDNVDDILDTLTYIHKVIADHSDLIAITGDVALEMYQDLSPPDVEETSSF